MTAMVKIPKGKFLNGEGKSGGRSILIALKKYALQIQYMVYKFLFRSLKERIFHVSSCFMLNLFLFSKTRKNIEKGKRIK